MLAFAQDWSWVTKSFVAMFFIMPIMIGLPMVEHRYGVKTEGFFFAWFVGCFVGFIVLGKMSPTPLVEYILPIWPVVVVALVALVIGSVGNVLLIQAMSSKAAPNPALPFAIVNLAGTLAYITTWVGGRFLPTLFPALKFNMVNVGGLLLIAFGVALIMYQTKPIPEG